MNKLTSVGSAASVLRIGLVMLALGFGGASRAQLADDPDWKESAALPPPAFDFGKLIPFTGAVSSPLVYGVDPASIRISKEDGVVRYVLVATGSSGARNVIYEGIRCATGEFKTYARYSSDGRWNDYWVPLDVVVEFKRGVYEMALTELSRFVPRLDCRMDLRVDPRARQLRAGMHSHDQSSGHSGVGYSPSTMPLMRAGALFELPPGATFEPDPQTSLNADPLTTKT